MTIPGELRSAPALPSLGELLARFMHSQAACPAELVEDIGEVVPHQPSGLLGPDARTALADALEPATVLLDGRDGAGFEARTFKPPTDWASLLRAQEPVLAVPCCVGNFPQLVKDVTPLLATVDAGELRPRAGQPQDASGLGPWVEERLSRKRIADALFGAGMYRLANQFDAAGSLLSRLRKLCTPAWEGLLRNEEAALAWHRGDVAAAAAGWARNPRAESPVLLLNRGLAALVLKQPDAPLLLTRAVEAWPEKSPWHHLARVYLTLCEA